MSNATKLQTPLPAATEDLFRHENGEWIDQHTIPADRSIDGAFHALRDQAESDVRVIIENADPESAIGKLYSGFMDEDAIEAAGVDALAADLAELEVEDKNELALALGRLDRAGVGGHAGFYVAKDATSDLARLYLVQSGLGLPDEAYYREDVHSEVLSEYRAHLARLFEVLDDATVHANDFEGSTIADSFDIGEAEEAARRVVNVEKRLAAGHWDVVASRDAMKTHNPMTIEELPSGFPWSEWFAEMGVTASVVDPIIVRQPSYLSDFVKVWEETDLEDLRLWALVRVLKERAPYLPAAFVEENFDFDGRILTGTEEMRARWKRGVGFVEGAIGQEVGKQFVAEHFPPENKERMLELVDYLIAAYRQRIAQLPWMTAETQERALEKLSQFKAKIGYPDTWRSYEGLEVTGTLMDDVRASSRFDHDYEVAKLGKPVNRDEWFATPQTVNAFYNPTVNDITFPAAILRPPFFAADATDAENFGAIGAVIGHEIGHGFDDQGSQYDGSGNLRQWWTDADRAAFEELTGKLVDQFDGLVPSVLKEAGKTDQGVNGQFTLGENIGDLGGLGIAVVAYRNWLADKGLDDSPEAFRGIFESWALVWRTKIRPEMAAQYLAIDPHSPAEFRCNVIVSNIDEFHEAFGTSEGDGMWRSKDDRVIIW